MNEIVYRDYGAQGSAMTTELTAPNNRIEISRHRQVYQATHEGENRLSLMNRSFISFSYGGKPIEDFDLIATIVSNRISKDAYAPFDDQTTTYDNLDGQYYWSTHYRANSLTFVLATDGIDQKTLEDFKFWFHAGEAKELILSEHPNRAIMARVSQPPELSLLPFEETTYVTISGNQYPTKTTLYKGEITLTFVMDEPHWYAIQNILGVKDTANNRYIDQWEDPRYDPPQRVDIFASQDALKILLEDGIPLGSMIDNNMLLGDGSFANVESNDNSRIWSIPESQIVWDEGEPSGYGARIYGTITEATYIENSRFVVATDTLQALTAEDGSRLSFDKQMTTSSYDGSGLISETGSELKDENDESMGVDGIQGYISDYHDYLPGDYGAIIAGAIVDVSGKGIRTLYPSGSGLQPDMGYFFYSGTAPSPTIISFDITPTFTESGYFYSIGNKYVAPGAEADYSTIVIESVTQQQFKITTPNIITSYNKALDIILTGASLGTPAITVRQDIIDLVRHANVRTWALALIPNTVAPLSVESQIVADRMQQFFQDDEGNYPTMHFSFNSKTGEAIGHFYYRRPSMPLNLFRFVYADNALNKYHTIISEDRTMNDEGRWENLVTWGWDIYVTENRPENNNNNYSSAIKEFIEVYNNNITNGVSMPGIFTAYVEPLVSSYQAESTEDVGDMPWSNNIFIVDRNYANSSGHIVNRNVGVAGGEAYSHAIYHNLHTPLENFQIQYRNMYL